MTPLKKNPKILVVGSANLDLVVRASHIPRPGETVLGGTLARVAGGKGANQACAVGKLDATVVFVGKIGDDEFGETVEQSLLNARVDCQLLSISENATTGVALIVVSKIGENAICVSPGANALITPEDIAKAEHAFDGANTCLLQLEIPLETTLETLRIAKERNIETILDPAPAIANAPSQLFDVDIICPNQTEAEQLVGVQNETCSIEAIASALLARGARSVVLKLGADGAYIRTDALAKFVPGFRVDVVDTTAAGDAFAGGLAIARSEGKTLEEAVRLANACGALACTRMGAQTSLPRRHEVEQLLRDWC